MYERLKHTWTHLRPSAIAEKVKRFFYHYSVNRHKLTVLTVGSALSTGSISLADRFDFSHLTMLKLILQTITALTIASSFITRAGLVSFEPSIKLQ